MKRYFLVVAIVLLLAGGAGLYFGSQDFEVRSLALVAIVAVTYIVRLSRVPHGDPFLATNQGTDSQESKGSVRRLWIVGIAFVLVAGLSYMYLYNDALHGYHEALPVYVFASVGVAGVFVCGFLVSRIGR